MNNKGFTLIELLAVVAVIALITGIASTSYISVIKTSKAKGEKVFVSKLENYISSYISANTSSFNVLDDNIYSFEKCYLVDDSTGECILNDGDSANIVDVSQLNSFGLESITTGEFAIISKDKVVNPSNKLNCLDSKNPDVFLYRDSDFVYYYYVDLRGNNTSCDISEENGIITNIPSKLCNEINSANPSIDCNKIGNEEVSDEED